MKASYSIPPTNQVLTYNLVNIDEREGAGVCQMVRHIGISRLLAIWHLDEKRMHLLAIPKSDQLYILSICGVYYQVGHSSFVY